MRAAHHKELASGSLEALIQRAAGQDLAAFAELYDRLSSRTYGLALRVLRSSGHAEEVHQECWLEIWRSAVRFDPARGSALGWILTMVHRRAVDSVRAAEARTRRDGRYAARTTDREVDLTQEHALLSLEADRVRRALHTLDTKHRAALELAYFDGCTHREVAERLQLPLGTAKTRIRQALITLRGRLESSAGPLPRVSVPV